MKIRDTLRRHWFIPLGFGIAVADFAIARILPWSPARPIEVDVLFDFAILLPILYAVCYRRLGLMALTRAASFICLGVWLAGSVIPASHHELLAHLSPLRYAGAAVLFLIELRLAIAIYTAAVSTKPTKVRRRARSRRPTRQAAPVIRRNSASKNEVTVRKNGGVRSPLRARVLNESTVSKLKCNTQF